MIEMNSNNKTCRICVTDSRVKTVNLFQYDIGDDAATAFLMRMCDITIVQGDGLPTDICTKCIRCLKAAYKFKVQCELTDKILRKRLVRNHDDQQKFCENPTMVKLETSHSMKNCEEQFIYHEYDEGNITSFSKQDNIATNSRLEISQQIPIKNELTPQEKLEEITEKLTSYSNKNSSTTISTSIIEQPAIKKTKARKNATCPVCYQKFEDYEDYRAHVRKHSGEIDKPYKCKACGKGFLCVSQLNRHLYTHSDVKLYECSVCKKGFNNAAHMKSHMYVHTGEKPYSCSVCDKGFNQMPHLKRHMQSHSKSEINNKSLT